mmetsp:Transcript_91154/g.260807  ORF Transcript_91154/g.260807 Transcript_91154/m.260807 type:complete len:225 (+) Transcript_91154:632-1306(+)
MAIWSRQLLLPSGPVCSRHRVAGAVQLGIAEDGVLRAVHSGLLDLVLGFFVHLLLLLLLRVPRLASLIDGGPVLLANEHVFLSSQAAVLPLLSCHAPLIDSNPVLLADDQFVFVNQAAVFPLLKCKMLRRKDADLRVPQVALEQLHAHASKELLLCSLNLALRASRSILHHNTSRAMIRIDSRCGRSQCCEQKKPHRMRPESTKRRRHQRHTRIQPGGCIGHLR